MGLWSHHVSHILGNNVRQKLPLPSFGTPLLPQSFLAPVVSNLTSICPVRRGTILGTGEVFGSEIYWKPYGIWLTTGQDGF